MAEGEKKLDLEKIWPSLRWLGMGALFLFHFYYQSIQNDERHDQRLIQHDQKFQQVDQQLKDLQIHKTAEYSEIRGEIKSLQLQLNDFVMRGRK